VPPAVPPAVPLLSNVSVCSRSVARVAASNHAEVTARLLCCVVLCSLRSLRPAVHWFKGILTDECLSNCECDLETSMVIRTRVELGCRITENVDDDDDDDVVVVVVVTVV